MKAPIFVTVLFWLLLPVSLSIGFLVFLLDRIQYGKWPDMWEAIKYFYFRQAQ